LYYKIYLNVERDMGKQEYRVEKDSMGEIKVPANALYSAQTQRAVENFPVSGLRLPRGVIRALGLIKAALAEANAELGLLDKTMAAAIVKAANEVADGEHDDQFPLDIFQTGSGTWGRAATMSSPPPYTSAVHCWRMRNCCRRWNTWRIRCPKNQNSSARWSRPGAPT
jgi:hypothetical protein